MNICKRQIVINAHAQKKKEITNVFLDLKNVKITDRFVDLKKCKDRGYVYVNNFEKYPPPHTWLITL